MAQTFLSGQEHSLIRPAVYYRRERAGVEVAGSINGYLAVLYSGNFGALNRVVDLDTTMMNNLEDYVGDAAEVMREGFIGGATIIRAVRVGGGDGACAEITLLTSMDVEALKISAKYEGDRTFGVTIRDSLIRDDVRECLILDGTEIFASYTFAKGGDEASALAEAMKNDRWFKAEKISSGELARISQMALDGGKNPTVTVASYAKGTEILEKKYWNCVIADTDDGAVMNIICNFVRQSYEVGRLGFACIAGKSSQDLEERMSYAAAHNDEKIVYVLSGWRDIYGAEFEGWKAAARIGGMIAGCEANTSLTHDVIQDALELIEPFTHGEILRAEEKGCLVLSTNDDDQIWVDNALTTLITPDDNLDKGWSKIRRTKTRFELITRTNRTHEKLIGNISNDEDGRATVLASAQKIINEMVAEHKLIAGSYVELDPAHPPEADMVYLKYSILDLDSIEKIFSTFVFRYGNTFDAA